MFKWTSVFKIGAYLLLSMVPLAFVLGRLTTLAISVGHGTLIEELFVVIIFIGTMLWVIGGVYSFEDFVWRHKTSDQVLLAEYVDARAHLIARVLQALGGSVAAFSAIAYYGLDTFKSDPTNVVGETFMIVGAATTVMCILIIPVVWIIKAKALELSLQILLALFEGKAHDADSVPHAAELKDCQISVFYTEALRGAKARGTRIERLAVHDIEEVSRQRAELIAKVLARPNRHSDIVIACIKT